MDWGVFLIFLAASGAAGSTGMLFQPGDWYESLKRPVWTPPNWVFPMVWTALYILIAWAGSRLAPLPGSGTALAFWALQIALNTLWTPVFFGTRRIGMGLIVISLLWMSVASLIWQAWALDGWATLMLAPYLVWVSIATALNAWVWRNN